MNTYEYKSLEELLQLSKTHQVPISRIVFLNEMETSSDGKKNIHKNYFIGCLQMLQ